MLYFILVCVSFSLHHNMQLLDLPNELLLQVISNLSRKQTQSLVRCSARLYRYALDDYFWFDLCRLKGINYCHPDLTWKQLYNSGDLSTMCPHLSHSICKYLSVKRQQLWSHSFNGNDILCLHPSCDYLGNDNTCIPNRIEAHIYIVV